MTNFKTFNNTMSVECIYNLATETQNDLEYAHTRGFLTVEGEAEYWAMGVICHEAYWYIEDDNMNQLLRNIKEILNDTLYNYEATGKERYKEESKIYKAFIKMFS